MQLPGYLRRAIDRQAHGHPLSGLSVAAAALSASYRGSQQSERRNAGRFKAQERSSFGQRPKRASYEEHPGKLSRHLERLAYLTTRLPSTYAAARAALLDTAARLPADRIATLLDLGAGPGTASHAAAEIFFGLREITLVEQDRGWFTLGKALADESPYPALQSACWRDLDLTRLSSLAPHDVVVLSYVVSELDEKRLVDLLRAAWQATRVALVIIEPGTPRAFARLRFLREVLLHSGAHMVGPCPHENACPMAWNAGPPNQAPKPFVPPEEEVDWCHFSSRVERSSLHRRAKGGTLGFEDEKYSYIAVSRAAVTLPEARIIRRPIQTSGSIVLRLCTPSGLQAEGVSRGKPAAFRAAKKARWGNVWQSAAGAAPPVPEPVPAKEAGEQDGLPRVREGAGETNERLRPPRLPEPLPMPSLGARAAAGAGDFDPASLVQVRLGFRRADKEAGSR